MHATTFPEAHECAAIHAAARFHPMTDPDHELPAIEVAGLVAFVYLDAGDRVVRVAVHLDTSDPRLLTPEGNVALEVVIGDTPVFRHPAPRAACTPSRVSVSGR